MAEYTSFEHSGLLSQKWVESKQKLRLSCIIGPPEGLENAILYGSAHGHLMDSSWRNKNNVKCPLTIISTICHYHRQIPGRSDSRVKADLQSQPWCRSMPIQELILAC